MTSQLRRSLAAVVVAALGAALGASGVILMAHGHQPQQPTTAIKAPRLHVQAVYDKVEPTVVDVTSALRYEAETAEGTGFVINAADGLVLTNNHVIRDATAVTITLTRDGQQLPARIVGADLPADVALLQVEGPPKLSQAAVANSSTGSGAQVVALGNQAGAGGTPTIAPGVITGTGQTIQANDASTSFTETLHDMLATSAHIAPGDSGGPLADAQGQVVGMITAAGDGSRSTGYAIPIDDALAAARLIAAGRPAPGVIIGTQAFLGVVIHSPPRPKAPGGQASNARPFPVSASPMSAPHCLPTSTAGAQAMPSRVAPARSGALVYGVLCGTGAAAAGLAPGDVITGAAGRPVSSPSELTAIVDNCQPGTVVPVTWVSPAGHRRTTLIRLDAAPAA